MPDEFIEAEKYLRKADIYGCVPGLESMKKLCARLGNPEKNMKFIHIAGTNGKGSVGAFISGILTDAGYITGRYNSPAVFDTKEKFQCGGQNIESEDFTACVNRVKQAADEMIENGEGTPTSFELETALAFCFFEVKGCQIAVLEAGMGGRLDATNIIGSPLVSVITSIGLDHTAFLGDTIEKIAAEKAGIIKENSRCVCVSQNTSVINVIKTQCSHKNTKLTIAEKEKILFTYAENGIQHFNYDTMQELQICLLGRFQPENAAVAIEVCRALKRLDYNISEQNIRDGLFHAKCPGRFECIGTSPYFIIDGAHNPDAAARLRESINLYFHGKKITYIMGMLKDKDCDTVARITADAAAQIFTITPNNKRGLSALELAKYVRVYNRNVRAVDSVAKAVELAMKSKNDVTIVFGSLSFLNEAVKEYREAVQRSIKKD